MKSNTDKTNTDKTNRPSSAHDTPRSHDTAGDTEATVPVYPQFIDLDPWPDISDETHTYCIVFHDDPDSGNITGIYFCEDPEKPQEFTKRILHTFPDDEIRWRFVAAATHYRKLSSHNSPDVIKDQLKHFREIGQSWRREALEAWLYALLICPFQDVTECGRSDMVDDTTSDDDTSDHTASDDALSDGTEANETNSDGVIRGGATPDDTASDDAASVKCVEHEHCPWWLKSAAHLIPGIGIRLEMDLGACGYTSENGCQSSCHSNGIQLTGPRCLAEERAYRMLYLDQFLTSYTACANNNGSVTTIMGSAYMPDDDVIDLPDGTTDGSPYTKDAIGSAEIAKELRAAILGLLTCPHGAVAPVTCDYSPDELEFGTEETFNYTLSDGTYLGLCWDRCLSCEGNGYVAWLRRSGVNVNLVCSSCFGLGSTILLTNGRISPSLEECPVCTGSGGDCPGCAGTGYVMLATQDRPAHDDNTCSCIHAAVQALDRCALYHRAASIMQADEARR